MSVRPFQNHLPEIHESCFIDDSAVVIGQVSLAEEVNIWPLAAMLGEDVTVGHKVILHGCTIGNRVLVGMGAIVLDDAVIEDEVMVGAGSIVPPRKVLESGYLYIGAPVKRARELTDEEKAFLRQSADNYVNLARAYRG